MRFTISQASLIISSKSKMSNRTSTKHSMYLAFDLETTKELQLGKLRQSFGISCAGTLLGSAREPVLWCGGTNRNRPAKRMSRLELQELVDYLNKQVERGYKIVTWNGLGFDFKVLAEESGMFDECRRLAIDHIDMMFHVLCRLGYGISLNSAAKGMELVGKNKDVTGILAPQLWAQGRRKEVLEYVTRDVKIILELAELCGACGRLCWVTRSGSRHKVALPSGWLPVRFAKKLPRTGTSWMWPQWFRERFTAWLD